MSEPLTREEVGKRLYTSLLDRDTYSEAVYSQLLATMDENDECLRNLTLWREELDTLRRELADERERGARLAAAALEESDAVSAFLTAWGAQDVAETDAAFDAMYDANPRLRAALDATGEATS